MHLDPRRRKTLRPLSRYSGKRGLEASGKAGGEELLGVRTFSISAETDRSA